MVGYAHPTHLEDCNHLTNPLMKIALDLPQSIADYLESEAQKSNSNVQQIVIQVLWNLLGDRSIKQEAEEQESEVKILSLLQSWEESEGASSLEGRDFLQDQVCDANTDLLTNDQHQILALLGSWIEESGNDEEPSATEDLLQSLSDNRFSERPLFPEAKQGRTW